MNVATLVLYFHSKHQEATLERPDTATPLEIPTRSVFSTLLPVHVKLCGSDHSQQETKCTEHLEIF